MARWIASFLGFIAIYILVLNTVAFAVDVQARVIIDPAESINPITLNSNNDSTCTSYMTVSGQGDPNVSIYLDDVYNTTADANGDFLIFLKLEEYGQYTFQIHAEYGPEQTEKITYRVRKGLASGGACTSGGYSSGPGKDVVDIPIAKVKEEIEEREEEIEETIEEVIEAVDTTIEPLDDPKDENDANIIEEAINQGITTTYEDFDEDGVSDVLELMLDLDIKTDDSDGDGKKDIDEITNEHTIINDDYELDINLQKDQVIECDGSVLHGKLTVNKYTNYPNQPLQLCVQGKEEACSDFFLEDDGSFFSSFDFVMKQGSYILRFAHDGNRIAEFPIACVDDNLTDVILSKVDKRKVYRKKGERFKKKSFILSLTNKPTTEGFGTKYQPTFLFWNQKNNVTNAKAIVLNDANGGFKIKTPHRLKTLFGFGRAKVYAYTMSEGATTAVEKVNFYIADIKIITIELLILLTITYAYRSRKKHKKKRRDR